jgi:hypothetical protein
MITGTFSSNSNRSRGGFIQQVHFIPVHGVVLGIPVLRGCCILHTQVVNGKPAPDVFLAAAQQLGEEPSACVCFEDAPSGVEGAVAAGMKVVMVPSLVEAQDDHKMPSADAAAAAAAAGSSTLGGAHWRLLFKYMNSNLQITLVAYTRCCPCYVTAVLPAS